MFVVSFLYKRVSELTMASTKEIPLKDVAGHENNVKVFLEFGISDRFKDDVIGRVELELFTNKRGSSTENFPRFARGEKGEGGVKGKRMHYKGVKCHRIIPGFMLQGGDHIQGDGSGGESIYGRCFADEWPDGGHVKHQKGGLLSHGQLGPDPHVKRSSSSPSPRRSGWTGDTWCSGRSRKAWSTCAGSRCAAGRTPASPYRTSSSGTAAKSGEEHVTRRRARRTRVHR